MQLFNLLFTQKIFISKKQTTINSYKGFGVQANLAFMSIDHIKNLQERKYACQKSDKNNETKRTYI